MSLGGGWTYVNQYAENVSKNKVADEGFNVVSFST